MVRLEAGHVLVADVAVGDQAHAQVGFGVALGDEVGDRPDLALGPVDQDAEMD